MYLVIAIGACDGLMHHVGLYKPVMFAYHITICTISFFEVMPCKLAPCKNGGKCKDVDDKTFKCTCGDDFLGDTCEEKSTVYKCLYIVVVLHCFCCRSFTLFCCRSYILLNLTFD